MVTRRALVAGMVALSMSGAGAKKRKRQKTSTRDRSADEILTDLARLHTHGTKHESLALDEQRKRVQNGKRVELRCGYIAALGVDLLQRAGYTARTVSTITKQELNGWNDGYILLEAWIDGAWRLYDLDMNRRARIGIAEVVQSQRFDFDVIADDKMIADDWPYPDFAPDGIDAWYARMFGVALIPMGQGWMAFNDRTQIERLPLISPAYVYVDDDTWRSLTTNELTLVGE